MADKENNAQETPQNTTDKAQAPKKKPSRPRSPAKKKVAPPKEADVSAVAQDAPSAQGNKKPKQTKQTDATPAPETTAKAADASQKAPAKKSPPQKSSGKNTRRSSSKAKAAPSQDTPPAQEALAPEASAQEAKAPQLETPVTTEADKKAPAQKKNNRSSRSRSSRKAKGAQAAAKQAPQATEEAQATALPETPDNAANSAPVDNAAPAPAEAPVDTVADNVAAEPAPHPQNGQKKNQQKPKSKGDSKQNAKSDAASKPAAKTATKSGKAKHRMFFSMLGGEQIEVAMAHEGVLVEYYLDMLHQRKMKGNIYKGVIHNIDTNLQAAFVDFGAGKNGFLQIDEVHPEYWQSHHEPAKGKKFPPIQKVLKAGQELLVQVVKEPTGNKGAFLTTWLSLAGRFLVLTPGQEQLGVSRKVEDDGERARLKELVTGIDPGSGMGVIVRTASAGTTKTNLKNDLQYLKRLWKDIRKKATEVSAPSLVHKEPGLAERAVRDYLTDEVGEIWVDNHELATTVRGMTELLFPRKQNLVHEHTDVKLALWDRFNLRRQIEQIHAREVTLPSGGRLVFDQTEALMAIDINSGKISGKGNFEAMAHKTNKEAAEAIATQLRLRDVGGQVVIDFIEMRENKHVQDVEKALRAAMKNDRARHEINHMSSFGLLELVRQRTGSSAISITLEPCPHCGGTGQRRNMEWQALQAAGELRRQLQSCKQETCTFQVAQELAMYLLNKKRELLQKLEHEFGKAIEIAIKV